MPSLIYLADLFKNLPALWGERLSSTERHTGLLVGTHFPDNVFNAESRLCGRVFPHHHHLARWQYREYHALAQSNHLI